MSETSIRISTDVHRRLLTIQYQLKMAGKSLSFSEIIQGMLDDKDAFARIGQTAKGAGL